MSQANSHIENSNSRLASLDQFRGFAILLMVLANYLSRIQSAPAWLKHAPLVEGLTVVDLIAPLFIFAIGLVYRSSFQRRLLRYGRKQTIVHFLRRFLALMGIGFLTPPGYSWGLLQTIAAAGLLTLLVIWLPSKPRLMIGIVLLGGYQVMLATLWGSRAPTSIWCEVEGVLGWAAMLILASVLADLRFDRPQNRRAYFLSVLASLALGIVLSNWIDVSRHYVTASYVMISLGVSGLVFEGFHMLSNRLRVYLPILAAWGKNPLVLYVLHYWIWVIVFLMPEAPWWHIEAPTWLIVLQLSWFIGILSLAAWFMNRRRWIISM